MGQYAGRQYKKTKPRIIPDWYQKKRWELKWWNIALKNINIFKGISLSKKSYKHYGIRNKLINK